jgi:phenylacetate-CoA ligase
MDEAITRRDFFPTLERMSRSELDALQLKKLQLRVGRAYDSIPFYRERYQTAGVSPDDIKSLDDLRRLPLVTKEDILADEARHPPYGSFLGVPEEAIWEILTSSGTSGKGREVHAFTQRDCVLRGSNFAVAFAWAGVSAADAVIFHVGASNSASIGSLTRGIRAVGRLPYLVGHAGFDERIDLMLQFGFDAMWCMPSALNGLSQLLRERGIEPRKQWPNTRSVMIAAESFPVEWVHSMEEFWGCKIYEEYGATQAHGGIGMTNCERGAVIGSRRGAMHFFSWTLLFEVLNPDTLEPVKAGEEGDLVITHLDKEASPLVRFRTRDRVRWFPSTECPCGRCLDFVESGTVGRWDDMMKVKGQNLFPPHVDRVLFSFESIDEYQGRLFIDEHGRDNVEVRYSFREKPGDKTSFERNLIAALKEETHLTMRVTEVAPDELPHFITPDQKARRWTDERQAGLIKSAAQTGDTK